MKKSVRQKIEKLAGELPVIYQNRKQYSRIPGAVLLKHNINVLTDGSRVDENSVYKSKDPTWIKYPVNHVSALKQRYLQGGWSEVNKYYTKIKNK